MCIYPVLDIPVPWGNPSLVYVLHALPWTNFYRRHEVITTSHVAASAGNVRLYPGVSTSEERWVRTHAKGRAGTGDIDPQLRGGLRYDNDASFHEPQLGPIKEDQCSRRRGDGRS
jgi:hypothetical protein